MSETDLLNRRLGRERAARQQAEAILENKALELYRANKKLQELNEYLEEQIRVKFAALQQSEQRYQQLIESIDDIIYKISPDGFFTFVSPAAEKLLGYTEREFIGKKASSFVAPSYRQSLIEDHQQLVQRHRDSVYSEFPVQSKDGQTVWIGQTVRVISSGHHLLELVGVARNVTARKQLEKELLLANAIAEEALQAEKQFLATISHEIRTPLNDIIGMSHLLFDTQLTKQQQEYIAILKMSADFLHNLISNLLDMTKIEAGRIDVYSRPFDVARLLRATQKVFDMKLQNRPVAVEVMLDARITGEFVGDEVILTQILTNLVGNAEKFTDRGSIQITAKIRHESDTTCWIEFSVSDTGIGIPAEKLDIIFQKFRQVDTVGQKYKGTGLGLAICKQLVELQGGTISVQSQVGKGSVFTFALPFGKSAGASNQSGRTSQSTALSDNHRVRHILVAEDNLMNQKYIGSLLAKWGVSYELATDGAQALEKAEKQAFDLILMDIQMPLKDGYEVTAAIRNSPNPNQRVPIIALTAYAMIDQKNEALQTGMNNFLTKPVEPGQLLSLLHQYGRARQADSDPAAELDQERLTELYGTDDASASEMLKIFLTDAVPKFSQLSFLCSQHNWSEVASLVHKLKPTLGMVGLSKLEEQMGYIERTINKHERYDLVDIYCGEIVTRVHNLLPLLEGKLQALSKAQP